MRGNRENILRSAVRRWPRLAGPIVVTVVLSRALFAPGACDFTAAADISRSPWLHRFAFGLTPEQAQQFDRPGFAGALLQGADGTFTDGTCSPDSRLWTSRTEFVGSFAAFGLALIIGPARQRPLWAALCLSGVALMMTTAVAPLFLAAFPVGVAPAFLLARHTPRLPPAALVVLLPLIVCLMGYSGQPAGFSEVYVHIAGAVPALVVAIGSPQVNRLLSARRATWPGEISFPLCLVHVLVLCPAGAAARAAAVLSRSRGRAGHGAAVVPRRHPAVALQYLAGRGGEPDGLAPAAAGRRPPPLTGPAAQTNSAAARNRRLWRRARASRSSL